MWAMVKKIIVVGSGIIGASIAYYLAKGGADVLVLEKHARVGGVATPHSWAWINASWGNPPDYVKLRMASMALWHELAAVNPRLAVRWCGGLLWDLKPEALSTYVSERQAVGYGARLVSRDEISRLEPALAIVPERAVHVAEEGDIDQDAATLGFLEEAARHGAETRISQPVESLAERGGTVFLKMADGDVMRADEIVLAAGSTTAEMLSGLDVALRMSSPAGLLIRTQPAAPMLKGLVMAPELHVRQTADGRLVAGSDFGGADRGLQPEATAQMIFAHLQHLLKKPLELQGFGVGHRPTPDDGLPAVGRPQGFKNLTVAVTHSGVTLAPAIGTFVAEEILQGERNALLMPFHPDRLR